MRILVLGGTAWLGHEIARALIGAGHDVTCAARSDAVPEGARHVRLDRDEDDALMALGPERWDAVVDVASQPAHVRRAARDLGPLADRSVFVSTGNVYASQSQVGADEDAAVHPPLTADSFSDPDDYGPAKVACETFLREVFGTDRLLVARASLIGGPGDHTHRTTYWPWRFAHPAVDDEVLVPDAPQLSAAVIDVRDLAAWLVHCIERDVTGTFNAVGTPIPLPEHLAIARSAAASTAEPVRAAETWLQARGVAEWGGPRSMPLWLADPDWYGFNARSNDRAVAAGLVLRPLEETLRDGLAWRETVAFSVGAGLEDADERSLLHELRQSPSEG